MLEPKEVKRWERLTDAMLRHAAQDDAEAFAQVVAVLERAQLKLPAVAGQLIGNRDSQYGMGRDGYSWAQLADALRVSRSAAWQRFGPHRVTVGIDD